MSEVEILGDPHPHDGPTSWSVRLDGAVVVDGLHVDMARRVGRGLARVLDARWSEHELPAASELEDGDES